MSNNAHVLFISAASFFVLWLGFVCLRPFLVSVKENQRFETKNISDHRLWNLTPGHVNIVVYNNSRSDIEINFWSDFGNPFHFHGHFLSGGFRVKTHDDRRIPSRTTVFWRSIGSHIEHHQDIGLSDIPRDLKSYVVVFELQTDGKWTVRHESVESI